LKGTIWESLCLYAPSPDATPNDFFTWMQANLNSFVALMVDQCTQHDIESLHELSALSNGRVHIVTISIDRMFPPTAYAVVVEAPDIAIGDMLWYVEHSDPSLPHVTQGIYRRDERRLRLGS